MTRHEIAREAWRLTQDEGCSTREAAEKLRASGVSISPSTVGRMVRSERKHRAEEPSPQNAPPRTENPYPGLTISQGVALRSLLALDDYSTAARKAGVDRAQLYRWRHEPEFKAFQDALSAEQGRMWVEFRDETYQLRRRGLKVLVRALSSDAALTAATISAALTVTKPLLMGFTEPPQIGQPDPRLAEMSTAELMAEFEVIEGGKAS